MEVVDASSYGNDKGVHSQEMDELISSFKRNVTELSFHQVSIRVSPSIRVTA